MEQFVYYSYNIVANRYLYRIISLQMNSWYDDEDSDSEEEATKDALAAIALCAAVKKKKNSSKKREKWSKQWLKERPNLGSYNQLLPELQAEDPRDVQNYIRMPIDVFHLILNKITPIISKCDTVMRDSISPGARLEATLRFVYIIY